MSRHILIIDYLANYVIKNVHSWIVNNYKCHFQLNAFSIPLNNFRFIECLELHHTHSVLKCCRYIFLFRRQITVHFDFVIGRAKKRELFHIYIWNGKQIHAHFNEKCPLLHHVFVVVCFSFIFFCFNFYFTLKSSSLLFFPRIHNLRQ